VRTTDNINFFPRGQIRSGFGAELINMSPNDPDASALKAAPTGRRGERDLDDLLVHVARGDQAAFEAVYDRLAGPVYGVIRRVLRDPAQAEEVTQEVLLEVWRTATRFDPAVGGAATWVMTIAHRRAIDRVRSAAAAAEREQKTAEIPRPRDEVAEAVEASLDRERVRRCLDGLTEVQRESITLAYYGGYSYRQVAGLLNVTLGAIKTRIRDGLIRMRDCLGVS
jgi:RNA polymerase sigma-70 factor (ECF subfamily)